MVAGSCHPNATGMETGESQGLGYQPTELKQLASGSARDPISKYKVNIDRGEEESLKSVSGLHISIFHTNIHTYTHAPLHKNYFEWISKKCQTFTANIVLYFPDAISISLPKSYLDKPSEKEIYNVSIWVHVHGIYS